MGAELLCISMSAGKLPLLPPVLPAVSVPPSHGQPIPSPTSLEAEAPLLRRGQLLSLSCSVKGLHVRGEGFQPEARGARGALTSHSKRVWRPEGWRFGETRCCLSLQDQWLQGARLEGWQGARGVA